MRRHPAAAALLLTATLVAGAATLDAAAIVSQPLWPWLAWLLP